MKMETDITRLQEIAKSIRKDVLLSLNAAGSGHTGASLGLADVFTALYFNVLHYDAQNPAVPDRDRLVVSVGHVAPVLYATLAHAGFFDTTELQQLRKLGSRLQGHPALLSGLPGIETSTGSLGQGLSIATGMALAAKTDKLQNHIFCICGDGELQEGQNWEAAMTAAHYALSNLTLIVDRNKVQIDGENKHVMNIDPLADKLRAFGWTVQECNGHDFNDLITTLKQRHATPFAIIAKTLMGKGVPEIENDYNWHGKAPNDDELKRFLQNF